MNALSKSCNPARGVWSARLFGSVVTLAAAISLFFAVPPAFAEAEIVAEWLDRNPPLDPNDPAWHKTKAVEVSLYPQRTVSPGSAAMDVARIAVRALYNGEAIALWLEWRDRAPADIVSVGRFADAVAVQWPVEYGPGRGLPYVGMGDPSRPVALWFWRADGKVETLAAAGFGSLTAQPSDGVEAKGVWEDGIWRVVFRRPLRALQGDEMVRFDPARQGLIPLALATWQGEAGQRDGDKRLSGWRALRFEGGKRETGEAELFGAAAPAEGNPEAGRKLMLERDCAGCHAFPGNPERPAAGPDLTYVGGIHNPSYLLESLLQPSQIIVPGKGFHEMEDGRRTSLMPPFEGSEQERRDITAFLGTLR
ncbi:MAG: hypothetical protein CMM60_11200 [Rhodospirillaceae bacterium]|jgi:DMSO reductase family type II enzyme heme b subunit|nr:hypothetical protein [Rhodospirillaceae bacterium]|tara:strand:+ start:4710 stop:5804 length:1095 start_codon:yes stop_codon:yes gene_type:complete